jgi:phosphopantetheine--protein transferase-like protein
MPAQDSISVGIDLVSVSRVESIIDRWGDRFLDRIFTRAEVEYCMSRHCPARSLAARFAAKEAFFKAVSGLSAGRADAGGGSGDKEPGAIRFKDVEIMIEPGEAPRLVSKGAAREALGKSRASVSLSHEEDMAVAIVITSPEIISPEVSG